MILILSGPGDLHADVLESELQTRGVPFARFDLAEFPDRARCSVTLDGTGAVVGRLRVGGVEIALQTVSAIWVRRPGLPGTTKPGFGSAARAIVAADSLAVLNDLWWLLDVRRVPAGPDLIAQAAHKGRQLRRAAELGFQVPATLTGNDPDCFLDFVGSDPGGFVTKRAAPSQRLADENGESIARYTEPLRPRDMVHAAAWQLCPTTVQRAVSKALELRVTVVGSRVFTAAIHSQEANHSRQDCRRFDLAHTPIRPFALPAKVTDRCVALVASFGLNYGAIDLVVTPDGRFVFLEINPSGQYLWIEQATGLPITSALADLLTDPGIDDDAPSVALPRSGNTDLVRPNAGLRPTPRRNR